MLRVPESERENENEKKKINLKVSTCKIYGTSLNLNLKTFPVHAEMNQKFYFIFCNCKQHNSNEK
jgi:hypothetical protein